MDVCADSIAFFSSSFDARLSLRARANESVRERMNEWNQRSVSHRAGESVAKGRIAGRRGGATHLDLYALLIASESAPGATPRSCGRVIVGPKRKEWERVSVAKPRFGNGRFRIHPLLDRSFREDRFFSLRSMTHTVGVPRRAPGRPSANQTSQGRGVPPARPPRVQGRGRLRPRPRRQPPASSSEPSRRHQSPGLTRNSSHDVLVSSLSPLSLSLSSTREPA